MCKSKAEGGQRCAAHTRPAYENATLGTAEWDNAAVAYASTPEGVQIITERLHVAVENSDVHSQTACQTALDRAANIREAHQHAGVQIVTQMQHQLPNGNEVELLLNPDRDTYPPTTRVREDGAYETVYVTRVNRGYSAAPLDDFRHILATNQIEVLTGDTLESQPVRQPVIDWVSEAPHNDMRRIVLLKREGQNPIQYRHTRLSNPHFPENENYAEWDNYNAALLLPQNMPDPNVDNTIKNINTAAFGNVYMVVVQKNTTEGDYQESHINAQGHTIYTPDNAIALADTYLSGERGEIFKTK